MGKQFARFAMMVVATLVFGVTAQAQTEEAPTSSNSIYRKKVGGVFFIEATAGPTKYNANRLANNIPVPGELASEIPQIKLSGPEYGGAAGFRMGIFTLGARMRVADYDAFKLKTVGLDMNFLIRVPYVHPYIRLGLNYNWLSGDKAALLPQDPRLSYSGLKANGAGATLGLGIRIPIIKYLSIAAGVDVSMVGLYIRGDATVTPDPNRPDINEITSQDGGAFGLQTSGIFALTLHI